MITNFLHNATPYKDINSGVLIDDLVRNIITTNHVALLLLKMAYSENVEVAIRKANTIVEKIALKTKGVVPYNATHIKKIWTQYRHLAAYTFPFLKLTEPNNNKEFFPFTPEGLLNFLSLAKNIESKLIHLPTNKRSPNKHIFNKGIFLALPETLNLETEDLIIPPFLEEEKLYYCQYEVDG